MPLKLTTYYQGSEIPDFPGTNTFHSKELFQIYEETPGYTPLLIMASEDGKPVARLLAAIRKSIRMFPPAFIKRCEIYGTGEYLIAEADKERIFGEMLEHLTTEALRNSFLIEFRNLENAMFGYKYFRSNRYFPVNWLRVRNSLHGIENAEQRFSPSRIRQIKKGLKNGAKVDEARTVEEIREFSNMLRHLYSSRIRKHFPNIIFFQHMDTRLIHSRQAKIFIVRYKTKLSEALPVSIRETMPISGFREVCERPMPCNTRVYWLYGKPSRMPIKTDSATWSSWTPDSHLRSTAIVTSCSASVASKAAPGDGSVSAGNG